MPTISDVARRAGVSPVTVSRVINHVAHVNPTTRAAVERAIAELGYVPNVVARSLRSRRTRTLGLLLPDITNPFWTTVARGVEDSAHSHGYSAFLCNTDENPAKQRDYLSAVLSQRVDGVILAPCDSDVRGLATLVEQNVPLVLVDRTVAGLDTDTVGTDSMSGARALVRHLTGLGHRRIGILCGPPTVSTAESFRTITCRRLIIRIPIDNIAVTANGKPSGISETAAETESTKISLSGIRCKRPIPKMSTIETPTIFVANTLKS